MPKPAIHPSAAIGSRRRSALATLRAHGYTTLRKPEAADDAAWILEQEPEATARKVTRRGKEVWILELRIEQALANS